LRTPHEWLGVLVALERRVRLEVELVEEPVPVVHESGNSSETSESGQRSPPPRFRKRSAGRFRLEPLPRPVTSALVRLGGTVAAPVLGPAVERLTASVEVAEIPRLARLDQLAAPGAADDPRLDHRGQALAPSSMCAPVGISQGHSSAQKRAIRGENSPS
jgi:hypothetical protein